MPLLSGKSNIGRNISTLRHEGKPENQAIAIAENVAGNSKKHGEHTSFCGGDCGCKSCKANAEAPPEDTDLDKFCADQDEPDKFCQATRKPGPCAGQKEVSFVHKNNNLYAIPGQTAKDPRAVRAAAESAHKQHVAKGQGPAHSYHVTNGARPGTVDVHARNHKGEHLGTYSPTIEGQRTVGTAGRSGLEAGPSQVAQAPRRAFHAERFSENTLVAIEMD